MKRRDVFLAALGLLILWQVGAMLIKRPILPAPWEVILVFFRELGNDLPVHFGVSLWRVTAGMALSVLAAAPAGMAIGGSRQVEPHLFPHHLPVVPDPQSGIRPDRIPVPGDWRYRQDRHHLFDFVLPDRGAGTRPGRGSPSAIASKSAQSRRGTARALPLYLPARQSASHPDRIAAIHRDSRGDTIHHRVVRNEIWIGLLYFLQR